MTKTLKQRIKKNFRFRFQPGSFAQNRAKFMLWTILLCFGALVVRTIYVQIYSPSAATLNRIAEQQYQRPLKLSPYRGTIYDRRKEPLAVSIKRPSSFVNPRVFNPSKAELHQLSTILQIPETQILEISEKKAYFSWLKRKLSPLEFERTKNLKIAGLDFVMEPARFYPSAKTAAQLLGYVGMDDHGLSGVERQYEKFLAGEEGLIAIAKDARGKMIVSSTSDAAPEKPGSDLYLTIDRAMQEIAEKELQTGISLAKAKGGFAVVVDPHTGKILALANQPTFDPNHLSKMDLLGTKNQALANIFEPGSVIKPLVLALALEKGLINENQEFDCENGEIRIGNHIIHDAHPPKKPLLSAQEIIMHSSNVGTYKIAKILGPRVLHDGLNDFGFGSSLMLTGFPGEAAGGLSDWPQWQPVRFANIAFGQGLSVSALELVQAYAALANGGNLIKPFFVERITQTNGPSVKLGYTQVIRRVLSPETSRRVRNVLTRTVDEAIPQAKPQFYSAGGKTGTSQKVDPDTKKYSHTKHLSTFIGFTPSRDPHLVIYVQIDEPNQPQSYGSLWAAPVFRNIAEQSLSYLNVAADERDDMKKPLSVSRGEINGAIKNKIR